MKGKNMIAVIDKVHTAACDRLIPFAVKETDKAMGAQPEGDETAYQIWCAKWTRLYFRTMTKLKKKAGLKVFTRDEIGGKP